MKWELELELELCRRHNGGLGFAIEITTQYIIAPAALCTRSVSRSSGMWEHDSLGGGQVGLRTSKSSDHFAMADDR